MHNFSYWSVGDGKDIDVWSEAWLEDGLYINKHINIPPHLLGLKVRELVDNEGKWNWSLLQSWMPPTLQQKIAASLPPSDDYGRDERYMAGGTAADFSVADIYNKLCGFNRENASTTWDKIWKLQVPERVRSFIWLAKHDRLLTNLRRKKMGLSHDMCLFCGNVVESTLHVLRDCPLAMTIWGQVVPLEDKGMFFMSTLETWMSINLNNSINWSCNIEWSAYWAIACHSLWFWRNKENHEEGFIIPHNPAQHVMTTSIEYVVAARNTKVVKEREKVVTIVKWNPPKAPFVKLNTDGAYKQDYIAGCGGVIRGSQGEWLGGFARCLGLCSAFVAELWESWRD